jgi:CubicO group peptidase (beta-lactamase class C family)
LFGIEARGIHGQRLYIAPEAEMVIARFGSQPVASAAFSDPIIVPQSSRSDGCCVASLLPSGPLITSAQL